MTWIVAVFIIIFILGVYLAGVFVIVGKEGVSESNIKVSHGFGEKSFVQTQNVLSFLKLNENTISEWVDGSTIITHQDFSSGNYNLETLESYVRIEDAFTKFVEGIEVRRPYVCMKFETKSIVIDGYIGMGLLWRPLPFNQNCVSVERDIATNVYFLSKGGKLVEVYYLDERSYE
jgi:hypothetical protein